LAQREDCELLVVSETPMERDRRWEPEIDLAFDHVLLDSWTLDLSRLAIGSGFRTRFDTYVYIPKRPLRALAKFGPDVVVAGGGGIWSSPTNIAALAARRWRDWAFVPWWGSFARQRPTLPRRVADPWVKTFMRTSDAWLVYGTRHAKDVVELGADRERVVMAPITPLGPDPAIQRPAARAGAGTRYLFVGRLIERKGLDVLLDAFGRVGAGELWIAGDGPLRQMVDAAAAQDTRIRVIGHAAGNALAQAYREADVLVVPSLYEPWGLVVHEGLAYGLPVIATDQVGAADDLVDPGVNGFIVPCGVPAGAHRRDAPCRRRPRAADCKRIERRSGRERRSRAGASPAHPCRTTSGSDEQRRHQFQSAGYAAGLDPGRRRDDHCRASVREPSAYSSTTTGTSCRAADPDRAHRPTTAERDGPQAP